MCLHVCVCVCVWVCVCAPAAICGSDRGTRCDQKASDRKPRWVPAVVPWSKALTLIALVNIQPSILIIYSNVIRAKSPKVRASAMPIRELLRDANTVSAI